MPPSRNAPSASSSPSVTQIDPAKVRVLELVRTHDNEVIPFDCYHPDTTVAESTRRSTDRLVQLDGDVLEVRTLQWIQSSSITPSVQLRWTPTGLQVGEVKRIRVRPWPDGAPVRTFRPPEPV